MPATPSTVYQKIASKRATQLAKKANKDGGVVTAAAVPTAGGADASAEAPKDIPSLPATPNTVYHPTPDAMVIDAEAIKDKMNDDIIEKGMATTAMEESPRRTRNRMAVLTALCMRIFILSP